MNVNWKDINKKLIQIRSFVKRNIKKNYKEYYNVVRQFYEEMDYSEIRESNWLFGRNISEWSYSNT